MWPAVMRQGRSWPGVALPHYRRYHRGNDSGSDGGEHREALWRSGKASGEGILTVLRDCARLYSGRPLHPWDLAETIVPMCFARPEDVSIGFQSEIAIETTRGHHQHCTFQLHAWKCRPTSRAKAFSVSRRRQREARYLVLPSGPPQSGSRRKQVGSVYRAGVFATVCTVTEIKPLKISVHLEAHGATQARTKMNASRVHSTSSCFPRKRA
jgi:hypothetical protein